MNKREVKVSRASPPPINSLHCCYLSHLFYLLGFAGSADFGSILSALPVLFCFWVSCVLWLAGLVQLTWCVVAASDSGRYDSLGRAVDSRSLRERKGSGDAYSG